MNTAMSNKKKIIIAVSVVLVVALVGGGVFAVLRLQRDPVNVYAVSDIAMGNWGYDSNYSYGTVRTDKLQTVYLSETQQVTQIHVTAGQEVKQGDALMSFDTSLTDLQLQRKNLEVQQLERDLYHAKQDYNELVGYKYYALAADGTRTPTLVLLGQNGSQPLVLAPLVREDTTAPTTEPTDPTDITDPTDPTDTTNPTDPTDPTEPEPTEPVVEDDPLTGRPPVDGVVETYYRVGGSGSEKDPWLYVFTDGIPFEDAFIQAVLAEREEAYVVFAQAEENRVDGVVSFASGMHFTAKEEGGYQFALFDASDYVGKTLQESTEPDEPAVPDLPFFPEGPSYTYEELQQMKAEKLQEIKELELKIRMSKLEYSQMQKELGDGTVYAEIDGVVAAVGDPETAYMMNEPVLKVSGGGGYFLEGAVSELKLDTLQVGQTVSIYAYESGTSCEGVISEITNHPSEDQYYSDGNNNVTFYSFTVTVDGSENLQAGESAEMTFSTSGSGQADTFFLSRAFLLQENGKSYVYVMGADEKLEKRELSTGRDNYGDLEIRGGLSMDEYIAFPYSKDAEEGAKTTIASVDELYQ